MKKISNLVMMALLTVGMGLTSCEDILGHWEKPTPVTPNPTPTTPTTVSVTSITLDPTALNKKVGDAAVTLTATVAPADATDKSLTWSSDKETVATVADGVVTIVGAGTAIITATANDGSGVEATCTVNVGLLAGTFSVSSTKQVQFSQGNLQATYDGSAWTWGFAENQWDYIGNGGSETVGNEMVQAIDPYISGSGTVDLFGWVGASSTWDGVNQYGITSSNATNATNGYGTGTNEALKSDWGKTIDPSGTTWRTLSADEWSYLFLLRSGNRYCKATVNSKSGVVLFPDGYTHPTGVTPAPTNTNNASAAFNSNTWSGEDWAKMEAAGCVFLPAAGYRSGSSVYKSGTDGYYWSSSAMDGVDTHARYVLASSNELNPFESSSRYNGYSVRLVQDVTP